MLEMKSCGGMLMKRMKEAEELPIYEVCGNSCKGILQNGVFLKNVSFRKIKLFLEDEE